MSDCLIVGGGIIGLSLAYELAGRGQSVRVIESTQPGREASWAGAGIFAPACPTADDPLERLTALANELHVEWAQTLRETTEVDNGFRRTGAIYLARTAEESERLGMFAAIARERNIRAQRLTTADLNRLEPSLRCGASLTAAYHVPDECQIRNPRHLKALLIACQARGVEIVTAAPAEEFETRAGRIQAVNTPQGRFSAGQVCLTTGCWTGRLAQKLGLAARIVPVRGQMVLLAMSRPLVKHIVNEESRYLVPRCDGRLLVGSTEEDVGFDRSTTAGATSDLLQFAIGLAPELAGATVERSWAGLRPKTFDGLPYLGRVPSFENAFVAAGHFRGGLQLSTATAVVMSQLMRGERPQIDLASFRLDRDVSAVPGPTQATSPHTPLAAAAKAQV